MPITTNENSRQIDFTSALPHELSRQCVLYLSIRDIFQASLVSRQWQTLFGQDWLFWFTVLKERIKRSPDNPLSFFLYHPLSRLEIQFLSQFNGNQDTLTTSHILYKAIHGQLWALVSTLIKRGTPSKGFDIKSGLRAISLCARAQQWHLVHQLHQTGEALMSTHYNANGNDPIQIALNAGAIDVVIDMYQSTQNDNKLQWLESAIHQCFAQKRPAAGFAMLCLHPNRQQWQTKDKYPLFAVADAGDSDTLGELLEPEWELDIEFQLSTGETPLIYYAQLHFDSGIQALHRAGANCLQVDKYRHNAHYYYLLNLPERGRVLSSAQSASLTCLDPEYLPFCAKRMLRKPIPHLHRLVVARTIHNVLQDCRSGDTTQYTRDYLNLDFILTLLSFVENLRERLEILEGAYQAILENPCHRYCADNFDVMNYTLRNMFFCGKGNKLSRLQSKHITILRKACEHVFEQVGDVSDGERMQLYEYATQSALCTLCQSQRSESGLAFVIEAPSFTFRFSL